MGLVIVDFDGTLFKGNSFNVMFQTARKDFRIKEWSYVISGSLKALFLRLFKGKEAFRHAFFKAFAKTFKGKTEEELDEFFDHLVELGKSEVNKALIHKLRQHEMEGKTVIIVSGAFIPFLKAFTKKVHLDVEIIGTEMKFDKNRCCNGKIGVMVNGNVKVEKVKEWLSQKNKNNNNLETLAYADSESDIPLFNYVQHPIVVNPNGRMKEIAKQNQWSIFV